MNKLAIISLAATMLAPVSAAAQRPTVAPPVKWEDTPDARLRAPAAPRRAPHAARPASPAGVTWHQPPARAPMAHAPAPHPMPHTPGHADMRHAPKHGGMAHPPMGKGHHPGAHDGKRSFERVIVHKKRGHHDMRGRHGINGYPHYRRIDRGFVVPQYWWGPGHHVQNWAMYDFPQPMHGGRWVRYYDDALLIDHGGRVLDGRWGMSWDEYGDEWGYDESGIPAYVGNGDFYPGEEDYAWVEGEQGRYAEGHGHGGAYGHGAYGYPGYGYAYPWYGYGYASGGMITVTETTVTTAPTVVEKVYVKEVAYSKPRRAHKVRRQATKRCTPVCCSC